VAEAMKIGSKVRNEFRYGKGEIGLVLAEKAENELIDWGFCVSWMVEIA
jgi:hypothetical protein